jgi:hypothetical protein
VLVSGDSQSPPHCIRISCPGSLLLIVPTCLLLKAEDQEHLVFESLHLAINDFSD